jgi:hypothetical protein
MNFFKTYKWLIIIILIILAGGFLFVRHLYNSDMKKLEDFVSSYEKFDKAISDFSANDTSDLQNETENSLIDLGINADFRISSLIKNDKVAMDTARQIADLSGQEFEALIAFKMEVKNNEADAQELAKHYNDLTSQRKAAYAAFLKLGS